MCGNVFPICAAALNLGESYKTNLNTPEHNIINNIIIKKKTKANNEGT